jgi:hypothetical protein
MANHLNKREDTVGIRVWPEDEEVAMRSTLFRRRFSVFDAMLFVAATAAAMAFLHRSLSTVNIAAVIHFFADLPTQLWNDPGLATESASQIGEVFAVVIGPFLGTWSLALLVDVTLSHRVARRGRWRRPGALAALVLSIVEVPKLVVPILRSLFQPWFRGSDWYSLYSDIDLRIVPGYLVLTAWLTPILSGSWRAEPTWPDRLGRVLGGVSFHICLYDMLFLTKVR